MTTNNIKKLRIEIGLKRVELSELSKVPTRTIDDWENGRRKPRDVYQLYRIAKVLDASIEDLINFDEEN
ncbi:helix-turn-helix transcriptional regulator [Viridibacillus arvi]|uniref:helix-turn-helix transcriptional regulator n=1 Tax=Viridibacillus arvi TaxID=263475 RepID=UPI0034CD7DBB